MQYEGSSSDRAPRTHSDPCERPSFASRIHRIVDAKPFPLSALRLAEVTRDPSSSVEDVLKVLETDPMLSVRLLRLVNSAGFALRTECTSVRHAATLVGSSRLHQIATTAAIIDMYDSSASRAARVLEHGAVVGALARYLADYSGFDVDEMFTCGMLHDLGKLMLLETDGPVYEALLESSMGAPDRIHELERVDLGFDHAELAGAVLSRWSIPDPVPKIVAWHHDLARAFMESPEIGRKVCLLRLADALSYSYRSYHPEEECARLARTPEAEHLKLSADQLSTMWEEVSGLASEVVRAGRVAGMPVAKSMSPSMAVRGAAEHSRVRFTERPRSAPAAASLRAPTLRAPTPSRATEGDDLSSVLPWVMLATGSVYGVLVVSFGSTSGGSVAARVLWTLLSAVALVTLVGLGLWSLRRRSEAPIQSLAPESDRDNPFATLDSLEPSLGVINPSVRFVETTLDSAELANPSVPPVSVETRSVDADPANRSEGGSAVVAAEAADVYAARPIEERASQQPSVVKSVRLRTRDQRRFKHSLRAKARESIRKHRSPSEGT